MGCDMVVALARATVDGHVLFGHNSNRPEGEGQSLARVPGRAFAPGEAARATHLALPQVRHTATVLACRAGAEWGYRHGLNEHGVAAGMTSIRTRWRGEGPALTGPDLVRLALERSASARQAVDVLTDLVGRHGQGASDDAGGAGRPPGDGADSSFLIADGREAYVLEACGAHWALQAVGEVRAVSDVCHLRQDWDRISRGLADLAIARGWWPENGSKLDFAGALGPEGGDSVAGLSRWVRATLLLEQQNGQIHAAFLRRLLADHGDEVPPAGRSLPGWRTDPGHTMPSLCRHGSPEGAQGTAASLVAVLGPDPGQPPLAWWTFGPPCSGLYFPLCLEAELPAGFRDEGPGAGSPVWLAMLRLEAEGRRDQRSGKALHERLPALQEQFDEQAREFLAEASGLKARGAAQELESLARSFMQHNLERFEEACTGVLEEAGRPAAPLEPALAERGNFAFYS